MVCDSPSVSAHAISEALRILAGVIRAGSVPPHALDEMETSVEMLVEFVGVGPPTGDLAETLTRVSAAVDSLSDVEVAALVTPVQMLCAYLRDAVQIRADMLARMARAASAATERP